MLAMRSGIITVALLAIVVSPRILECLPTSCQIAKGTGYVGGDGGCPLKLTAVPSTGPGEVYSECITVHAWIKADDFCEAARIEILSPVREIIRPILRQKRKEKCNNEKKRGEIRVKCERGDEQLQPNSNGSVVQWKLVHTCIKAESRQVVSVVYRTTSSSCNVTHTTPDPRPDFDLSVNRSSKSITVTVEPGDEVYTRWCYRQDAYHCMNGPRHITIDPSQSRSALMDIHYLLPCVCVQAYYTHQDALRHRKCPLENQSIADVRDVWKSSNVTVYVSSLIWRSPCPARDFDISASLCWKQREHLCIPALNSTLEGKNNGKNLKYITSSVDKHPQMCVQFSLQGSHNIFCPFLTDKSSWEVNMSPGRQSVFLHLTSSVPATFSAQLCVSNEGGCAPMGEVHAVEMDGNMTEARIKVLFHSIAEKPCVQVWQSAPALHGRRILCPDYAHNRCGMYAVAALTFVVLAALLGILIHRLTKSGTAGWLCIQQPVLLVCSSEKSAHVSAVCALASILQGELGATVHLALWALSSQSQAGARTGVADLGPLPWLYGQWEAVRKAQGKVLIVWSPESKKTYERWRDDRVDKQKDSNKAKQEEKERKCKKEKVAGACVKLCDDIDWSSQMEPSTVIAPVFTAALACLEGALQGCKGEGVAFVYFQGQCHSRDIPKAFRGVPRYCLPQDLSGLIQELDGMRRQTKTGWSNWHCWPRLVSKVLSVWLARQLAQRLQTLLPQTQEKQIQAASVTSSLRTKSDKTQSRFKLPLAANTARPGTVQEHQPLRGAELL